jgi:thymidylate kinase
MPPLVVEFIGLPGAGKTTIARFVIEELTNSGYRCFGLSTLSNPETVEKKRGGLTNKLKTLYSVALSCVFHKQIALDAVSYALHLKPLNLASLHRVIALLVRLDFMRTMMNSNYDLIILDQGLIQYIWSMGTIGGSPTNDKYLEQLLQDVLDEVSLLVILVDVEVGLAVERINNRSTMRSRFDRFSTRQAETLLVKHKNVLTRIVDFVEKFKGTVYMDVSGNQAIKKNVSIIVPFIERAWQASVG